MDALLVLDNSLTCRDVLSFPDAACKRCLRRIHHGLTELDCIKKRQLKCCDIACRKYSTVCDTANESGDKHRSSQTTDEPTIFEMLDHQLIIDNSVRKTLSLENHSRESKSSSGNGLPRPYSVIEAANPGYHFETLVVAESNSKASSPSFLVLSIDSYLASAVTYSLTNTDTFWIGFSNFITELFRLSSTPRNSSKKRLGKDKVVYFLLHHPKKHVIDYHWCYILQSLVTKRMILEEMMAWLSTLGGGYSALGDFVVDYADEAGRISIQQLKIALELGDAIIQCKCRMFFALSLMQKGQLRRSKQLLRNELNFIRKERFQDEKVKNMWKALWIKLRYTYQERKMLNCHTNGMTDCSKAECVS